MILLLGRLVEARMLKILLHSMYTSLKEKSGAVFISTGWPPFRYCFSIKEKMAQLLKGGAIFQNGSRVEQF